MGMMDIFEDLFYDFTTGGIIAWILLSVVPLYAVWFIDIPSLMGDTVGFPFITKLGATVFLPPINFYLIKNKEWVAELVRKK